MRNRKLLLAITLTIITVSVFAFLLWASISRPPSTDALDALRDSDQVIISTDPWLTFEPKSMTATLGVIIYPGGRVDPRAYAAIANRIAAQGYFVVIVPMPLNLAVLAPQAASNVITRYPEIDKWVVGGHSLGGAMAANFARRYPEIIEGLFLWASYPASGDDLSDTGLSVISIYATNDQLATPEEVLAAADLLPADTIWIVVQGGNHAQFARYGVQPGDGEADLPPILQENQIFEAMLDFLKPIDGRE